MNRAKFEVHWYSTGRAPTCEPRVCILGVLDYPSRRSVQREAGPGCPFVVPPCLVRILRFHARTHGGFGRGRGGGYIPGPSANEPSRTYARRL